MDTFANDQLDPAWCGGDLLLTLQGHDRDVVTNALREVCRATRGSMQIRWKQDGFTSAPRPTGHPRNLLGFKDGIAGPNASDDKQMGAHVWAGAGEPAWAAGGSYYVMRRIRMLVEFWDRVSVREQNTLIGRERSSGAPLTGSHETDAPVFTGPGADAIAGNAHIRLASDSGAAATTGQQMLRRGYNYDAGIDVNGNLDMGLIFTTFNQDLERQFVAVQRRLAGEPLADYVLPYGGGYFFALPGVRGSDDWLGREMFA